VSAGALSLLPAVAHAEGKSIAEATPVVYGQQQFGNTSNGGEGTPGCFATSDHHSYRSWWALNATAGDEVKVDWQTHQTEMNMNIFAVGSTDFTFLNENPVASSTVAANFSEEATYTAVRTGVLPLEFHSDTGCGNEPGPYNFTASVLHAVVLSVPTLTTLPQTGSIFVGVHNPDGVPISDPSLIVSFNVEVSGGASYAAVGAAPVANGAATIIYSLPAGYAGHSVTIQAASSGPAYLPGASATEVVSIPQPPPPPPPPPPPRRPCIVPAVHHHETLAQMQLALHHANCAVGVIRHVRRRHVRRGYVLSLGPRPGSHLAAHARVQIVLSRGRH
jgi:hypothetical protein